MKKALVIVQNKNNTTRKFGEEIAAFLLNRGLSVELIPINNFEPQKLKGTDFLLLGGTGKNDSEWATFVKKLPTLESIKTAMFNTYRFVSVGMFRSMKKYLGKKTENLDFAFKSKDGSLSISDKLSLNDFIK